MRMNRSMVLLLLIVVLAGSIWGCGRMRQKKEKEHVIADADGGELCQAKDQELYAQGASQDANHRVGFFSQPNADCHGEHVGEHSAVGVHAQHRDQAAFVGGVKHTGDGNQRTGCNVQILQKKKWEWR